ncbi:MAG: hypothetical protein JRH05_15990 [Deltaproteobacteria bacterium]|nr:hypothetical protein [Deltaproteobacteria bacterium]
MGAASSDQERIDLFNLYVGEKRPQNDLAESDIGHFTVTLMPDYEQRIKQLHKSPQKHTQIEIRDGKLTEKVSFSEERPGKWEITAIASFSKDASHQSILLDDPINDNGLWDLCEILTFITGRRVTTEDRLERYSYKKHGEPACIGIETLRTASLAWKNRNNLRNEDITYALFAYNEALNQNDLHTMAALYTCALNIICDNVRSDIGQIPKKCRNQLSKKIESIIDKEKALTDSQREAYKALIKARVMQGPFSALDNLRSLLQELDVIPSSPSQDDVLQRVKFINVVRNRIIHTGKMPTLPNLTREQSARYTVSIIGGVIPEICRMFIGKKLGFAERGLGSLSLYTDDLKNFFEAGQWRGWNLKLQSFEDWFYGESL